MRRRIIAAASLLIGVLPYCDVSKVASDSLSNLVTRAEWIVVAKVTKVSPFIGAAKHADLEVIETWKGVETNTLHISVARTWVCDISTAEKGETAVFFLVKDDKTEDIRLLQAGRGRMPIREVNGKKYATFWPEVRLPKEMEVISGPEPKWDFIQSVNVDMLKTEVLRIPKLEAK